LQIVPSADGIFVRRGQTLERTLMKSLALAAALFVSAFSDVPIEPTIGTDSVPGDADDPAIWADPRDPSKSLIIGTDKVEREKGGGLYVFGFDGKLRQGPLALDRPNNVDVEQGVTFGGSRWDIAVAAERGRKRLAIFRIDPEGKLSEATGATSVFEGEVGERGAPMGIALYKRPKDGALFAIVSRKEGPEEGYLWQYRLDLGQGGLIDAKFVRKFGKCLPGGEIEALLVDDELGFVYGAEEKFGIRKYHADPDVPNASQELAVFGKTGFPEDREGLGLYATGPGKGYILCSDQRDGGSYLRIFPRERAIHPEIAAIPTVADATDGIETSSRTFGAGYRKGIVVMMNSKAKNFMLFPWEKVAGQLRSLPSAGAR
jgi:3-phytase